MDKEITTLTVYFEEPFWVGVFERVSDGALSVRKVTFGAEPKDYEVWDFILKRYDSLKFSPAVSVERKRTPDNPKRRQRDAKRQLQASGVGTKSQQALQAQREALKAERKRISKAEQKAERKRQYDLKRQKRKEKHKGR